MEIQKRYGMTHIEANIDHIYFKPGDELAIHYSQWNHKSNDGEGGWDMGTIVIYQDTLGIIIVSKKRKMSRVKISFKKVLIE